MKIEDRLENIDTSLKSIVKLLMEGVALYNGAPGAVAAGVTNPVVPSGEALAQQKAVEVAAKRKATADAALAESKAKAEATIPKGMKVEEDKDDLADDDLTTDAPAPKQVWTQAHIVNAVRAGVAKDNREAVKELLTKYGAQRAPHVKEQDYDAFMAEIKQYI